MHTNAQATAGIVGSFYQCWASHLIIQSCLPFVSLWIVISPWKCVLIAKEKPSKAQDGREQAGKRVNLIMATSNICIQPSVHSDMQQFQSQLWSLHVTYLATQQAQTTTDAAASRANITTGGIAQVGVHISAGTLAGSITAGPAICKAEAGKSTRDLCKRFPALMSHRHLRKALPAPPDTEFWCLSALPLY